jgi:hypothetical protein
LNFYLQEENGDQQSSEKSTVEKEEEIIENNDDEEEEEEEDVQSFVTALENENDHVTDSLNGFHLGHDDDGKKLNIYIFL